MSRPDTLAGPHRKATPPQPKRAKIFLQVLFLGLAVWYTESKSEKRKEIKMKENTKKIIIEILENELHAVEKGLYFINAAIITAEAEGNTSIIKTQNRLKNNALQRIETLKNAIKDLNE